MGEALEEAMGDEPVRADLALEILAVWVGALIMATHQAKSIWRRSLPRHSPSGWTSHLRNDRASLAATASVTRPSSTVSFALNGICLSDGAKPRKCAGGQRGCRHALQNIVALLGL